MLLWLAQQFQDQIGALRVFNFITFRAVFATLTALLIGLIAGPAVIRMPCGAGYNAAAQHSQMISQFVTNMPGINLVEMDRNKEKSFCCGAGGGRMWMEETIGTRVNMNRGDEALSTGATKIAVACPFCSVMLNDAVTVRGQEAGGDPAAEVVDVATLLLDRVKQK